MDQLHQDDEPGDEIITMMCTPSKESATGAMLQGIAPDQFDPDTGIYRGHPATQEQLEALESAAGRLVPRDLLRAGSASRTA